MNIKSRLKKMESRMVKVVSEFCDCNREPSIRLPGEPPFPEFCDVCYKPRLIIKPKFDDDIKINEYQ
ncbi:hypothetical protein BH10ACI1_BH10ACI1_18950 [soil metagenome]